MNTEEKQALTLEQRDEVIRACEGTIKYAADYNELDVLMARVALAALTAQPFAWFTDDAETDKSATTYSEQVAERWRSKSWPVTPLYTRPAPGVSLVELVPPEMTNEMAAQLFFGKAITAVDVWNTCRAAILRNIEEAG